MDFLNADIDPLPVAVISASGVQRRRPTERSRGIVWNSCSGHASTLSSSSAEGNLQASGRPAPRYSTDIVYETTERSCPIDLVSKLSLPVTYGRIDKIASSF